MGDPDRENHSAYLRGDGALSLDTDPPGAEILLSRYELSHRRLVVGPQRSLGTGPIKAMELPRGSYLVELRGRGCVPVRYPVHVGRLEHWHGIAPGERQPRPVVLPAEGSLRDGDCYVPAGWFWAGGDGSAAGSLPRTRVWVDGFVVQRFPVTNREYVAFLDDLVDQGRVQDALRFAPSERRSEDDTSDRAIIYGRRADGHFELVEDADGDLWGWDWPVLMLDWVGVHAYLEWLSERTGQAWRLPWELEWEKMARGTDARTYPWGDFIDPSWACTIESHADRPLVTDVDQYPVDESPYGIRGLGGGVYDLCGDRYEADGPSLSEGRFQPVTITRGQESSELVVVRGGCWTRAENHARSAGRGRSRALERNPLWCFRPVRSL